MIDLQDQKADIIMLDHISIHFNTFQYISIHFNTFHRHFILGPQYTVQAGTWPAAQPQTGPPC